MGTYLGPYINKGTQGTSGTTVPKIPQRRPENIGEASAAPRSSV